MRGEHATKTVIAMLEWVHKVRCLSATCATALLRLRPGVWVPGVLIWDLGVYPGIAAAGVLLNPHSTLWTDLHAS